MPFPAARLLDVTVTGDVITGPGAPNVLILGQPAACLGDLVSGAAVEGAITTGSTTVMIDGRSAARTLDVVEGVNPETGVPVTTTIAPTPATAILIGP